MYESCRKYFLLSVVNTLWFLVGWHLHKVYCIEIMWYGPILTILALTAILSEIDSHLFFCCCSGGGSGFPRISARSMLILQNYRLVFSPWTTSWVDKSDNVFKANDFLSLVLTIFASFFLTNDKEISYVPLSWTVPKTTAEPVRGGICRHCFDFPIGTSLKLQAAYSNW